MGPSIEAQSQTQPAPVTLDGEKLFDIQWGYGSITSSRRAESVSQRIKLWADDLSEPPKITFQDAELSTDLLAGDRIVASVFEQDAQQSKITRRELAARWAASIEEGVRAYRVRHSPRQIALRTVVAIGILTATILCLMAIRRLLPHTEGHLERRLSGALVNSDRRLFHLISFGLVRDMVSRLFVGLRWILHAAVLLAALEALLLLLPGSRSEALRFLNRVKSALSGLVQGIWDHVPELVLVAIIAMITYQLLKVVHYFFDKVRDGTISFQNFRPAWAPTTARLVSIFVVVLAILIAYPYIPGSESAAFKGVSIFLGALVSLGSTGLVGNVVSGIMLTYMDGFQTGDYVQIGDTTGYVTKTALMTTRLRTRTNRVVTIPNSLIMASQMLNFSTLRDRGIIVSAKIGVGYDVPWRQVEALMLAAAERTPGILRSPSPFVLTPTLNQFDVTYELNAHVDESTPLYTAQSHLNRNILDLFNEYSVQIMTPSFESNPERPVVVPKEQWYASPAAEHERLPVNAGSQF